MESLENSKKVSNVQNAFETKAASVQLQEPAKGEKTMKGRSKEIAKSAIQKISTGITNYNYSGYSIDTPNNGEGGIRTHGAFRHNGFRDRHIQPLCHLSRRTRYDTYFRSGYKNLGQNMGKKKDNHFDPIFIDDFLVLLLTRNRIRRIIGVMESG